MDIRDLPTIGKLRSMPSADAADWLLMQDNATALRLLSHLSLKRSDNLRLARHHLASLPFANGLPYAIFAKRIGVPGVIRIVRDFLPVEASRIDLLLYYLGPCLMDAADSSKARDEAVAFISELRTANGLR